MIGPYSVCSNLKTLLNERHLKQKLSNLRVLLTVSLRASTAIIIIFGKFLIETRQ